VDRFVVEPRQITRIAEVKPMPCPIVRRGPWMQPMVLVRSEQSGETLGGVVWAIVVTDGLGVPRPSRRDFRRGGRISNG
jgi:hypothetical protein